MTSDNRPLVSVIVPVYNVERFLNQALISIERQTLRDIEIICVNDGSTDRSRDIMQSHADHDGRIRIIDKKNGGYGAACNTGIAHAGGTWIAIVEPDDWIESTMFADMVQFAETFSEEIDIVKTPYWRIVNPDTPEEKRLNCSYKGRIRPKSQPFDITVRGVDHLLIHHPSIWSALYRAEFLGAHDIKFREIPGAGWADNPFLVETLCQARTIAYLDKAYYCYREETEEKSASFAKNNATIPFDRWHDMADVLERLNVDNERVLRAHSRRGFTYLDYVTGPTDAPVDGIDAIMSRMFARMHDDVVMGEPNIPPAWKRRYREVKGLPAIRINTLPYWAALVGAGLYSLKNIGPREMIKLVGAVAKRDKKADALDVAGTRATSGGNAVPTALISIVIPVFNGAPYLKECFDSLAEQTYGNFEVICVDDGSTDDSAAIIERYAAGDNRVSLIRKPNGGPSSARNVGIAHARGDYIVFLDCDDLFEPKTCLRIAETASEKPYDAIVFGWTCFPAEEANAWLLERTDVRNAEYTDYEPALLFNEMTNPYLRVAVQQRLFADERIRFDEQLRVGEDAAFLFDLFPKTHATRLIADKLYRYRMPHEGSIMSSSQDGTPEKCFDDLNMMISIFGSWQHSGLLKSSGAPLVHWLVSFLLYTVLRQPAHVRASLVALVRQLFLAHYSPAELHELALPAHDFRLIDLVLSSAEDGELSIGELRLTHELMAWRIAEYGVLDIASTVKERIGLSAR